MSKYRVEAHLTDSDDGTKWGPHIIEFDTEVTPRNFVHDRFRSIEAVLLRTVFRRENLLPNSPPLAYETGLPVADSGKPSAD